MNHKDVFFRLQPHHQRTIRVFLGASSVLSIVEFAAVRPLTIAPIIGLLGNLVFVYWFVFPHQAWDWFFTLIPYLCAITVIVDGLAVTRSVVRGELLSASAIASLVQLVMVVLVLPAAVRYQRNVIAARRADIV